MVVGWRQRRLSDATSLVGGFIMLRPLHKQPRTVAPPPTRQYAVAIAVDSDALQTRWEC